MLVVFVCCCLVDCVWRFAVVRFGLVRGWLFAVEVTGGTLIVLVILFMFTWFVVLDFSAWFEFVGLVFWGVL